MKKNLSISFFVILVLIGGFKTKQVNSQTINEKKRFAVLFYDESDSYISEVKKHLQEIQQNDQNKVEFIFYDGKNNQETQINQLEEAVNNNVSGILVSIVDFDSSSYLINMTKEKNIPIIFFNREPSTLDAIKSYRKSLFIGTSGCQSGIMQGELISNQLKNNSILDRNNNKQLEYILLKGERGSVETEERSKCVIEKIRSDGINMNEIYSEYMNWNRESAKERIEPILSRIGGNIDLIISNNDEMAIGAIEALQSYGFNLGDNKRYIPVIGIDGIPIARELIEKGLMEGTVVQDARAMAEALYLIGFNLVMGKEPLYETNYVFDHTGVAIRVPYPEFIVRTKR